MKKFVIASALSTAIMFSGAAFAVEANKDQKDECAHLYLPFDIRDDLAALPADKQALIKNARTEECKARIKQYEAIEKLRAEIRTILEAKTFDEASFVAKKQQVQNLRNEGNKSRTQRIANIASQLTPEQRHLVINTLAGKDDIVKN